MNRTLGFYLVVLVAAYALPSAADDYTVTIPAGAANDRFLALCSQLEAELGSPPAWTLDKCARRFVRLGAKEYYRLKINEDAFANLKSGLDASMNSFESDFPDQ